MNILVEERKPCNCYSVHSVGVLWPEYSSLVRAEIQARSGIHSTVCILLWSRPSVRAELTLRLFLNKLKQPIYRLVFLSPLQQFCGWSEVVSCSICFAIKSLGLRPTLGVGRLLLILLFHHLIGKEQLLYISILHSLCQQCVGTSAGFSLLLQVTIQTEKTNFRNCQNYCVSGFCLWIFVLYASCMCILICNMTLGVRDNDVKLIRDLSVTEIRDSSNTCLEDCMHTCNVHSW